MTDTLEARIVRTGQTLARHQGPATLSDQHVELDVTEVPPYLQRRPSQWFTAVNSQLDHLLEVGPNWDSYHADPPSSDAVASARGLLLALGQDFDLPAPRVSPTRTGGVLLEWESGSRELEIEVVSRDAASFLFTDRATGEEYEGEFFRDESLDNGPVSQFLERLT